MTNLEKAKIKLLKMSKEEDFLVFDDIAEVCSEYDVEDFDKLSDFLKQHDVVVYESFQDAEDNGEIILWEDLDKRFNSFKKALLSDAKNNNNTITVDSILDLADNYELEIDDDIDDIVDMLRNNSIEVHTNEVIVLPYYVKKLCRNPMTFERGKEYFKQMRVINLKTDKHSFTAKVLGRQPYNVKVVLHDNDIIEHYCDCEAHKNHDGLCKHVVAAILQFNSKTDLFPFDNLALRYIVNPKNMRIIPNSYQYTSEDLYEIHSNALADLAHTFRNDESVSEEDLFANFRSALIISSGDPLFDTEGEWIDDFEDPTSYMEKRGIKVEPFKWGTSINISDESYNNDDNEPVEPLIDNCDDSDYDDYIEEDYDDYIYEDESDREIDCGYRDDSDYDE